MQACSLDPRCWVSFFPDLQATIFPKEMKNDLYTGAQLGVGLYMFLVGMTLQLDHFKTKAHSAMSVSFAGVAVPFLIAYQGSTLASAAFDSKSPGGGVVRGFFRRFVCQTCQQPIWHLSCALLKQEHFVAGSLDCGSRPQ